MHFQQAQRDPNVLDAPMLDLLEANNMPQTTKYL
ncbi:protein of unknown function [Cupriavidus taiwanensis]|uniref:Uncharacterized protein n=1 Tax=Cupriavidus taiwanensis TaxID=164546 RepID=A0A7Z7NL77_9BURK|nr:hypothetical protein CBM2585_A50006 [Cupriavidus taiwanensis]SOY86510.1 protein of unknown function [Cupriavidus taiwanensis]SOZ01597.1 hypothetical protein CBM2595_A30448 [Cupriavidus taiwanensis]SOZ04617.1 hypothetical protein CBM2597_A50592 [Cupriavidus taiwanensis]SPC09121.1 hypothetical protein CBM2594_A40444 [Cupriavidus taiwanensis]